MGTTHRTGSGGKRSRGLKIPNSELLAKIKAREPDNFVERVWRKLTGKKKTKREEREAREAKGRAKLQGKEMGQGTQHPKTPEVNSDLSSGKEDDGVSR